jgi:hypothetical protein
MEVGGQRHAPAALPPGTTRHPLCRRLGGPQSWSGSVRKISAPPGFDPRTIQSVANLYTDCAIPAHSASWYIPIIFCFYVLFVVVVRRPNVGIRTPSYSSIKL